ncbi:MAG: YfiR family protein [Gemmatimonadetes bacterium]|nr:MAG: YfiR family protein [Gemmatimonadota bacterium]
MSWHNRPGSALAVLFALIACAPAAAAQQVVGPEKTAEFLLRALGYDRALPGRTGATVEIVLLYAEDESSVAELQAAFEAAGAGGVQGKPVSITPVRFESVAPLLDLVRSRKVAAVYIGADLATALSSIQQVTRASKVASMTGEPRLVEQGVSLGVIDDGGQPRITVNLRSSRVEGLQLSADLLGISKVIR